jgi:hypothetical protein
LPPVCAKLAGRDFHCAAEAGVETAAGAAAWLERVEATPGFVNDLAPFPEHARR